jgi:hypothetical protein
MSAKVRTEAKLQSIISSLEKLEAEHEKGEIDIGRYLKLKEGREARKVELEQKLAQIQCKKKQQPESLSRPERLPRRVRETLRGLTWKHIAIVIGILLAPAVAIRVLVWLDIEAIPSSAVTPVPTIDNLADAGVSFTITFSNDDEKKIPAGNMLSLIPGDGVLIKVDVTVGSSPFPHDLTYRYFAPRGNIPDELTGPSASYVAPEQIGPDVITVSITDQETRNEILRSISVIVGEKSP